MFVCVSTLRHLLLWLFHVWTVIDRRNNGVYQHLLGFLSFWVCMFHSAQSINDVLSLSCVGPRYRVHPGRCNIDINYKESSLNLFSFLILLIGIGPIFNINLLEHSFSPFLLIYLFLFNFFSIVAFLFVLQWLRHFVTEYGSSLYNCVSWKRCEWFSGKITIHFENCCVVLFWSTCVLSWKRCE